LLDWISDGEWDALSEAGLNYKEIHTLKEKIREAILEIETIEFDEYLEYLAKKYDTTLDTLTKFVDDKNI